MSTINDSATDIPPIHRSMPATRKSSFLLAEHILRDIVMDDLQPGDALPPERVMVEKYAMGRGTVREALRLLEYQGALQIRPGLNGGPFVTNPGAGHFASTIAFLMQINRTPFKAIVEVRSAIEPMISRLAAERISQAALDELRRTVDEMLSIVERDKDGSDSGAHRDFNELNTRFHNVVAWSSGNSLFRYLADSLLDLMDGAVVGMRYHEKSRRGVIAAHETILAALEAHDGDAAATAMRAHLDEWEQYAQKRYPEALEQAIPWTSTGSRL